MRIVHHSASHASQSHASHRTRSSRSIGMRCITLFINLIFLWNFVLALPTTVWAQALHHQPEVKTHRFVPPSPKRFHSTMRILQPGPVRAMPHAPTQPSLTMLDQSGLLSRPLTHALTQSWVRQLRSPRNTPLQKARLHLWLGEWELAQNEQPQIAQHHFESAEQVAAAGTPERGLAAYDRAIALYSEGAYAQSTQAFHALLASSVCRRGFDPRNATLWLRHAGTCAGYHTQRAKLGIPEPARLDPLCGAAALAASLRSLHLPYDKATLLHACRVTGRGSDLQDLILAAKKLGVAAHPVFADDRGLKALPKPCVAFVERDHFISVTQANEQGVTYLCSDCGPWPGGAVPLSWKQWHALEPRAYLTLTRPGSLIEKWLSRVLSLKSGSKSALDTAHLPHYANLPDPRNFLLSITALQAQGAPHAACVFPNNSLHCPSYIKCPMNCNCGGASGPSAGDPVNLATGEEEYRPAPDLTVSNPNGPSVVWSRIYDSLRGWDPLFEYDDFGLGWSHPYNVGVYDPTIAANAQLSPLQSVSIPVTGSDAPAGTLGWDLLNNGATVATSLNNAGWNVQYGPLLSPPAFTVIPPSGTPAANNFEVRYHYVDGNGNSSYVSAFFDLLPANTVPQGVGPIPIQITGSAEPNDGTWEIANSSGSLANSTFPGDWNVTYDPNGFIDVSAPSYAALGSSYIACIQVSTFNGDGGSTVYYSGTFTVSAANVHALTGTKYVYEANGARIPFTANSVPSATQTSVACPVAAGVPLTVTWNYSTSSPLGTYTLTHADRSQWITTTMSRLVWEPRFNGNNTLSAVYCLGKLVDRNAHFITFSYGTPGSGHFPLLSVIKDQNQVALLTFNRNTNGSGNLISVVDRYTRCINYVCNSYSVGYEEGYPQSFPELNTVSQVGLGTGGGTRDTYGYGMIANVWGEQAPLMNTITVPSPTGTGTSTATINYLGYYEYVSSIVDANGNTHTYLIPQTGGASTEIMITNAAGTQMRNYTVSWDPNMSTTQVTRFIQPRPPLPDSPVAYQATYADPNDPYRPSEVQDGNGVYANNGSLGTGRFTWDSFGNLQTTTSPYGIVTTYSWSYAHFALGELQSITEGTKSPTKLAYYEPSGNVKTVTLPRPGTTGTTQTVVYTAVWDSLGNLTSLKTPGNNATLNAQGVDQGMTTTFNYTTDGSYTQTEALGEPLTITDNLGNVSHRRYYNHAVTGSDPIANTGLLKFALDASGNQTNYFYTSANQLQEVQYPATPGLNIHLAYDMYGRLETETDATSTQSFSYDDDNLPDTSAVSLNSGHIGLSADPSYYPDGSLSQLASSAGSFTYTYNGRGDLTGLTNPFNESSSFTYFANGWLQSQQAGSAKTTYSPNGLGQIVDVSTNQVGSGTLLADFNSTGAGHFDGAGDLLGFTANLPSFPPYSGSTSLGYDTFSQLTSENSTRGGSYQTSYGYDASGNPTLFRGVDPTNGAGYNADNQNPTFQFDGDGNPQNWQQNPLTFDANDKLTSLGAMFAAGYDGFGQRTFKQTSTATTYFFNVGGVPLAEVDPNGNLLAVNTWGPNGLISRHTVSTNSSVFYTWDLQGGCAQRRDSNANVVSSYVLDSYGNRVGTDSSSDPYSGYGGQWGYYRDSETGLYLLGARYYDPGQGRFLNRDPIGYDGGFNLYSYVGNAPTIGIDPSGFQAEEEPREDDQDEFDPNGVDQYGYSNYVDGAPVLHDPEIEAEQQGLPTPEEIRCFEEIIDQPFSYRPADVIAETFAGRGNISSAYTLPSDEVLEAANDFLGPGYREIGNPGSGVYRSADGLRQFRMDPNSLLGKHAPGVPHVHFEIYPVGGRFPIVNNHVPITE